MALPVEVGGATEGERGAVALEVGMGSTVSVGVGTEGGVGMGV